MRVKKLILILAELAVQANSAHNASIAYVYDDNIYHIIIFVH